MTKVQVEQSESWELIDSYESNETYRLKVPGGWLYRSTAFYDHERDSLGGVANYKLAVAMVFVPDPEAARR